MSKVLVTGATGFIGLHCIQQLLSKGYEVNGTVRNLDREDEIRDGLSASGTSHAGLELFSVDLNSDEGWDEAMNGCEYVLHVASPISLEDQDEDYFVKPAVAGVKRALSYAKKHSVKKVVLTSSVAAIFHGMELKEYYDENDWSDPENPSIDHYSKSKTLAERAAWDFVESEDHPFELAVINPALVIGRSLTGDLGESNKAIEMVVTGKMPVAVPLQFGYVDVRDVAAAHILAMKNPESNGKRFALAEKDLWYKDVAEVLIKKGFDKAPTFAVPAWLAKILAMFSKDLKLTLPYLGRLRSVRDAKNAKDILGWKPRPAEESIIEIAEQIQEMGLIK